MSRAQANQIATAIAANEAATSAGASPGVVVVTPLALATRTSSAQSASFPTVSAAVQLSFLVTGAVGPAGNTLDIELEHSADETNWFSAPDADHAFDQIVGGPGTPFFRERGFPLLSAFWRINATIAGGTPSYTFQIDATQIGGGGAPDNIAILVNNTRVRINRLGPPVSDQFNFGLTAADDEIVVVKSMILSSLAGNGGNEVWTVASGANVGFDGSDILQIPSTGKIIEVNTPIIAGVAGDSITIVVSADDFTGGFLTVTSTREKVGL